jgi:insertion element IS1 protein InsB
LSERAYREEWTQSLWQSTVFVQGVWHLPCADTQKKYVAKAELFKATRERISLRGLARVFGVTRKTIKQWLNEAIRNLPSFSESVNPAQTNDVLELDELWSFVGHKKRQVWLWIALCRRTRQVVAYALGDRSTQTCQHLYDKLPASYRTSQSYSDFWDAYQAVFPKDTHQALGKEAGQTNHVERWNNTLRQRMARFVRKTLSFSKSLAAHHMFTKWFIFHYNLECVSSCT